MKVHVEVEAAAKSLWKADCSSAQLYFRCRRRRKTDSNPNRPLPSKNLLDEGAPDRVAKTLRAVLPAGDTIGLVPAAIPGVDIDIFRKGVISKRRSEFFIPPDDRWQGAYDWLVE